jgi:N-acetyl-anhydromuramyl-L-alanine amidase AmpD
MIIPAEMAITTAAPGHGDNGVITRVVLHDEEYPVSDTSAESIAAFFTHNGGVAAHYVVDANSIQHCVPENQIAWHAPPNAGSVGIEHDGYVHFTAADWAKPGSQATLKRSAILTASICARHSIPVVFLSIDDLRNGKHGITYHAYVSKAFGQSDHSDPGVNFPIAQYLAWVKEAYAAFSAAPKGNSPLLVQGMNNSKVADVQHALDLLGNETEAKDGKGKFGTETHRVLLVFQKNRSLPQSGVVDPITWAALRVVAHPKKV